jgi:hypothetical protein
MSGVGPRGCSPCLDRFALLEGDILGLLFALTSIHAAVALFFEVLFRQGPHTALPALSQRLSSDLYAAFRNLEVFAEGGRNSSSLNAK